MNAPERIWLQDGGDYESAISSDCDVTWCVDSVGQGDTEYIRADLVADMVAAALNEAARIVDDHYADGNMGNPGHHVIALIPTKQPKETI